VHLKVNVTRSTKSNKTKPKRKQTGIFGNISIFTKSLKKLEKMDIVPLIMKQQNIGNKNIQLITNQINIENFKLNYYETIAFFSHHFYEYRIMYR